MIKNEEEYFKVDSLVIAMEDMAWLYEGVESSLNGLTHFDEAKSIKKALDSLSKDHHTLFDKMQEWEKNNKLK